MPTKKPRRGKPPITMTIGASPAVSISEDELKPKSGRKAAEVQIPRNVKAPTAAKEIPQMTQVSQVATTKMAEQSTSTQKKLRKRGSRARY